MNHDRSSVKSYLSGMVELRQTPVDKSQPSIFVIDHDIMRLYVSMHDAHAVTIVESLKELVQVVAYVVVGESLVQLLEVRVVDVFEDEGRGSGDGVFDDALEGDDIRAAPQVLQNLDFSFDLLLFHRLQRFDDALLVVCDVDGLEDLRILAAAEFSHELVVILVAPLHNVGLIVPVVSGPVGVDVGVDACSTRQRHPA